MPNKCPKRPRGKRANAYGHAALDLGIIRARNGERSE